MSAPNEPVLRASASHPGAPLDATSLLEKILTFAPSWYTGIGPEDPIAAGELLALCRAAGEVQPAHLP